MVTRESPDPAGEPRRYPRLLIAIVVGCFVLRLGAGWLTRSWIFPPGQHYWTYDYEMARIGSCLASGQGFSYPSDPPRPTAWMPPVYPLIIGMVFKFLGSYSSASAAVLEFFQALVSALTCIPVFYLGRRFYSSGVGLIAAGLFAVYPASIHFAVQKIWSTSLVACLLLAVMVLFLRQVDRPSLKGDVGLGMAVGFLGLLEPVALGAVYPAVLWMYWRRRTRDRDAFKGALAIFITSFLLFLPLLVRNYAVFREFVFIKSNFGHELLVGNSAKDGRFPYPDIRGPERLAMGLRSAVPVPVVSEAEQSYLLQSNEAAQNRFYFGRAIKFISDNPRRFLGLCAKRFVHFWSDMRSLDSWGEKVSSVAYHLVLLLGIIGILRGWVHNKDARLGILILATFPLPYYLTLVWAYRYRFPVEPLLLIFASFTLGSSYRMVMRKSGALMKRAVGLKVE